MSFFSFVLRNDSFLSLPLSRRYKNTEMANNPADQTKLCDETYTTLMQDDENMRARINALLNQINENRVKVKELHAEYAIKFGEIVTFKNRLDMMSGHYDDLINSLLARKEEMLKITENEFKF